MKYSARVDYKYAITKKNDSYDPLDMGEKSIVTFKQYLEHHKDNTSSFFITDEIISMIDLQDSKIGKYSVLWATKLSIIQETAKYYNTVPFLVFRGKTDVFRHVLSFL